MPRMQCPQCATVLNVPDSATGAMGKCQSCGHRFRVPGPASKRGPASKEEVGGFDVLEDEGPAAGVGFDVVADEASVAEAPNSRGGMPAFDNDEDEIDEKESVPRQRRRREIRRRNAPAAHFLGISLRQLLIFALFLSGLLASACCLGVIYTLWRGTHEPIEDTETALAALEAKNAEFTRDGSLPGRPVITLKMSGAQFEGADLKHIRGFTQLRELHLAHAYLRDIHLSDLEGLTNLEYLDLSWTGVTDSGMESLAALKNLRELDLSITVVTDSGLARLQGLTKLRKLHLVGTNTSGAGLAAAIPGLQVIK